MSHINYLVAIIGCASLWLYCLTFFTPTVPDKFSASLRFPTNLQELKNLAALLSYFNQHHSYYVVTLFCSAYLYKQAFIIPGSVFMNLLAGALFGVLRGFLLVCFLTALGASLCYLISRCFGGNIVQYFFPAQIKFLQDKVNSNADRLLYFLLFLRLFPMTPNWLINLLSPVVGIPLGLFFITVFIGLMPYNLMCVQAGGMLASIKSIDEVFSVSSFLQLIAIAIVALGPGFILKRKYTFQDNITVDTHVE